MELPADSYDFLGPRVCLGPLSTGLEHLRASLADPTAPRETGSAVDTVRIGHETAAGTVIQLYLDRAHGVFSHRDVAMLRLVEPVVVRLMTTRPRIAPNGNLSLAELRVLELLSSGASNRDISERLFVSVATVRKHLEHCYRKLGVTNRTAAVAALSGREAVTDLVDSRIG